MKIAVIGASGYLGSELLLAAQTANHEVLGTYHTHQLTGLVSFALEDVNTWDNVLKWHPDIVIWTAVYGGEGAPVLLTRFIKALRSTPIVYVSSDIVDCPRALKSKSAIGDYARRKRDEQDIVLASPNGTVYTVGPIYGTNHMGVIDKRTKTLLDEPNKQRQYWDDVYKTFVDVTGLAQTVVTHLDKHGRYYVGPATRRSFYAFYVDRAQAHNLETDNFEPTTITDEELAGLNQCRDISYEDNSRRLWSPA